MDFNMLSPCYILYKAIGRKLAECLWFITPLIFRNTTDFWPMTSLWAAITSKRRLGHPNQIHFLNPECVRIPWVLAPENFPVENFRVRSVLQKSSIFHWFLLPPPKKKYRARVPTILMPETFPIARLTLANWAGRVEKGDWICAINDLWLTNFPLYLSMRWIGLVLKLLHMIFPDAHSMSTSGHFCRWKSLELAGYCGSVAKFRPNINFKPFVVVVMSF